MSRIEIQVSDSKAQEALQQVVNTLDDTTSVMAGISLALLGVTEQAFAQGGYPVKWTDLAARTKAARAKRGTWPGQILQDSGQLAASITPESGRDFAQIGTNKVQAAALQFGAVIHHNAYAIKQRLRTDAKGNLQRQGKDGKLKNLAVYAGKRHKRAVERVATVPAHDVIIPARPFLPVDAGGGLTRPALEAVMAVLEQALK